MITPRDRFIVAMEQVVKPIADTRNDYDIFCALSQRLGESRKFSNEWTAAEWIRWIYEESRKKAETFNVDLPSYEDLKLTGWHEVSFPDSFEDAFSAFRQNPNKEPLQTASGKIEITSSMISEFGDEKISPHPVWQEPTEWLGAENDEYPFHLISSQPSDKLHSQLDHGSYSRSQKMSSRTPVDIHPADANHLGIQHGDIVRIYNSRGACLGAANFTTDMMQGVLRMSTGAWLDAIQQKDGTLLCLHGNPNTVTRDVGTSELAQGPTAHSCLVAIELYLDAPDVKAFEPPEILSN
jgi:biotin/methionine sulfoxide reductase